MIRDTKKFLPKHPVVMATSTILVDGGDEQMTFVVDEFFIERWGNDCGGNGELNDGHEGEEEEEEEEFNVDNGDMNLGISLWIILHFVEIIGYFQPMENFEH